MKQSILSSLLLITLTMPVSAGVYMENFNDGGFRGWQPVGRVQDCWKVVDGELCGDTDNPWGGELVLSLGGRRWGSYNIACDIKFIELYDTEGDRPHVAIGTRPEVEDNVEEAALEGITFKFGFQGVSITSRLKGKSITTDSRFEGFIGQMDTWYRLKLVVEDNIAQGYVGDKLVCELKRNMPNYISPSLSFASAHVRFDNVILWGNAIPTKHIRAAVTWATIKGKQQ